MTGVARKRARAVTLARETYASLGPVLPTMGLGRDVTPATLFALAAVAFDRKFTGVAGNDVIVCTLQSVALLCRLHGVMWGDIDAGDEPATTPKETS